MVGPVNGEGRGIGAAIAVLAVLVIAPVLCLGLALVGGPWEAVIAVQPLVVLLLWLRVAQGDVRGLGFPGRDGLDRHDRRSGAQRPSAGAIALLCAAVVTGGAAAVFLATGATAPLGVWLPRAGVFAALGAVVLGVLAAAIPEELVYRGVLVQLTQPLWPFPLVIGVSGLLFCAAHIPNLLMQSGSWIWLALRCVQLLVLGTALAWAAVRTGALWIPLGWHAGSNLAGVFVELVWVPQVAALWPVAVISTASSLVVIPLVLLLERHSAHATRSAREEPSAAA